jgi:hypothetical protein
VLITSSTRRTAALVAAATTGLTTVLLTMPGVASAVTVPTVGVDHDVTMGSNTCSVSWTVAGGAGAGSDGYDGGVGSLITFDTAVHPGQVFSLRYGHPASGATAGAGYHAGGTGLAGGGGGGGSTAVLSGTTLLGEAAGGGGAGTQAAGGPGGNQGDTYNDDADALSYDGGAPGDAGGMGGAIGDGDTTGTAGLDATGGAGADSVTGSGAGGGGATGGGSGAAGPTGGAGGGGGSSAFPDRASNEDIADAGAPTAEGSVGYVEHDCDVPGAPDIQKVGAGEASATVEFWPADVDEDSPVSAVTGWKYSVDGSTWHPLATTGDGGNEHTGTISGLTNGQTYPVRVRATSASGDGAVSDPVNVTPVHTVGAPTGFAATVSEGTVHLSWQPPAGETGIVGYHAGVVPGDGERESSYGEVDCPDMGADARSCDVTVVPGTRYTAAVLADNGAPGEAARVVTDVVPALSAPPVGAGAMTGANGAVLSKLTAGQSVTLTGSGYQPDSTVQLYVYSSPTSLGAAQVDDNGDFSQSVTLPAGLAPGAHHLVSVGYDPSGKVRYLVTAITVATPADQLAWTGFETLPWAGGGGLAVALGVGMVLITRRRRTA